MHLMDKLIGSFRAKMVFLFVLSMFLSSIVTFLIFKGLQFYYQMNVQHEDSLAQIRMVIRIIGDFNVFFVIFILISFIFFLIFTKPYSKYFQEISNGIHSLAHGEFKHKVSIQSNDEFGNIAKDINLASEKLKEAIQRGDFSESSKDQLVVNLAHDLRTPLTSVLGYLDLILKEDNLTNEQTRHFLTIALTKSERLENLIDELFEVTRMNYGMLPINKTSLNIRELLHQLTEELYPLFEKNRLVARISCETQLYMKGDGDLLARVFENLTVNAIRYGNDGQFIDIKGFIDKNDVVIQIVNYGNKIPENELPHLFDMFYTGDKSRTHQKGSSGLGLFIAKNIIEQHNGLITAKSSIIQTTFEIRLPNESIA